MNVGRTTSLASGFVARELGRCDVLGCSERVSLLAGLGVSGTAGLGVGAASESDRPDLLVCDGLGLFSRSAARAPAIRISSSVGSADVDLLLRDLGLGLGCSTSPGVADSAGVCSGGGAACLGASGFVSRATITSCPGVWPARMKVLTRATKNPLDINRREKLQPVRKPPFTKRRLSGWSRDFDHRQGKTHPQFVLQINLHVVHSVLLKLHPAKIMDVGRVPFHLLQNKFYFRLRDDLLLVDADDAGFLPKFAGSAAPARPDAEPHVIDRQGRRGDDAEHSHQRLHTVNFAPDVLAKNGTLQIWENDVGAHGYLIT
jgi:hypothetical protein